MSRRPIFGLVLAAALVGGACGGGDDPAAPTVTESPSTSATGAVTTGPPTPADLPALSVSYAPDVSAAVISEVDGSGGTLTTTDAAGAVYTLTIPEGALRGPEAITMTPIGVQQSDIEGLTIAGVALEPEGLVFLRPATLEIERANPPAAAFGSSDGGSDFHLTPASVGTTTRIPVPHFSEVGVIEGRAEADKVRDGYRGGHRQVRYLQELATVMERVEDPEARLDAVSAVFDDWFADITRVAEGANSPSQVNDIYAEFLVATSNLTAIEVILEQALSSLGPAISVAASAIQDATDRMFREANLRCIQDREPNRVFEMLRWGTLHQFLWDEGWGPHDRAEEFEKALDACMRFEASFKSNASGQEGDAFFSADVRATVELGFGEFGPSLFFSRGDFRSPEIEDTVGGFAALSSPAGDSECNPTGSIGVILDLALDYGGGGALAETSVGVQSLLIRFPVIPTWICTATQGSFNVQEALWYPWFLGMELDLVDFGEVFTFPLEPGSGDVYGRYENRSVVEEKISVDVTIELRHDPQLP
jgi:hypothetical protein